MRSKVAYNLLLVFTAVFLILVNLYGVNFGTSSSTPRLAGIQPYNSFKEFITGGLGEHQDAMYGWNITFIDNLNGDSYPDLVVSTPWYDSSSFDDIGVVYIFYGSASSSFDDVDYDQADVTIRGDGLGNKFGWAIADAGDTNDDGINDLIVGAPGALNNRGRAYIFYGGTLPTGVTTASAAASRILAGLSDSGSYGTAVIGPGDINNDGYDDVLVGAPNDDQAVITYGYKNFVTFYPNIWDDDPTSRGVLSFDQGLNNTPSDVNTWGLGTGDDGWDWTDYHTDPPLYGGDANWDICTLYAPWEPDGPDADGLTWNNRTELEITLGRNHTYRNPYENDSESDPGASAAWGIEFIITQEMYDFLSSNSTITVGFDYEVVDTNKIFGDPDDCTYEACTINSRIWNGTDRSNIFYLGDIYGRYVFYHTQSWNDPSWGPISDSFEWDITDYIDGNKSYYWDFGCYMGWGWKREHDGMQAFFDNVKMKISNDKTVIIQGAKHSGFGSAMTAPGDINGDGYADMVIGAPSLDGGYVALIHGKKRFKSVESLSIAYKIITGEQVGDGFGFSIANAGYVDNDNLMDIIIGAPGGDYAKLYYGTTLNTPSYAPDLWENFEEKDTPKIEFNTGVRSTGNTPGPGAGDDGWEVWNGVYGSSGGNGPGSSTKYNGEDTINVGNIANDDQLTIAIGGRYGNSAEPDSGAYGVQFQVSSDMIQAIKAGGNAVISYNWWFEDVGLDMGDDVWIRTYIRNITKDFDLGWELDSKQAEKEIYWSSNSQDDDSTQDIFVQGFSECLQNEGAFYFDLGGKVESWEASQWNREDGIFYFDNVHLRINHPPDIKFIGESGSGFGYSVGYCDKLNYDDDGDIVIGAPYYDSPNGVDSGAIFGFYGLQNAGKIVLGKNAEYITYGENLGDNFGWILTNGIDLDSDEYNEFLTSAVKYDSSSSDIGKIYILSITKVPRIRLIYPLGGELITGNVTVNATVVDPDNDVDNSFGVRFSYTDDPILGQWTVIGDDKTPQGANNIYEHFWNTAELPDGSNYYVKAWVKDLLLNIGENISLAITVDNPHQPELSITNPMIGEVVAGSVEIKALVRDSELDNIGGGVNLTRGVNFYFSEDQSTWTLLGSDDLGTQNVYSVFLETEQYPDGEYWIKVNATDLDGFWVEETINITIDNPGRPPSLTLLSPLGQEEISGESFKVRATAFDFDGDINSSGVTFYIATHDDPENWAYLGNAPVPEINTTGAYIYTYFWDTTTVEDNWYLLRAYVMDNETLTNESISGEFKVHNEDATAPYIKLTTPKGGETVKETQIISAHVRDLEDNIDSHGVDYYYSDDKIQWRYIGTSASPRISDKEYYDFLWKTDTVPDGEYWLSVSVSDTTELKSWDGLTDPIFIHNSQLNPPIVKILAPARNQYINGTFIIQASALDLEHNIDSMGVVFYYSIDMEDWNVLDSAPLPTETGGIIYELSWDTTVHSDGKYWLRAEATDYEGLKGETISDYFFIHNAEENPPLVTFLSPNSGEISGQVKLNATAFDLENNIKESGVNFYYSTDGESWQLIGNDPTGNPMEDEAFYHEITWDTTLVSDDIYWLRAEAEDLTNLIGFDNSDEQVIVHNKMNNPPRIIFKQPKKDVPLDLRVSIVVDVIDFEDDVETVSFFYSPNNKSWELIDSLYKSGKGYTYNLVWDTEKIVNGDYYLKIIAKDTLGNQAELTEGPFEITEGVEKKADSDENFLTANLMWIILVIIIVIVMFLVVFFMLKRSKRREKELLEEVSAELRESRALEGEVESVPGTGAAEDTLQSYVPASQAPGPGIPGVSEEPDVETIESYKTQMDAWKAEGYNMSRLEQMYTSDEGMFARTFPVFSSNITRLKDISGRLESISAPGHEDQVNSIRAKLYDPDQALAADREMKDLEIKLGLATPALGSTPQAPGVTPELPPIDVMLPQLLPADTTPSGTVPEAGAPVTPAPEKQPEIPESPFASAQTQTLEEEMGKEASVVEMPVEPDVSLPEPEVSLPGQEPPPTTEETKEIKKAEDEKET